MLNNCPSSVTPIIVDDPCQGNRIKTACVISTKALTYLGLPPNSTLENIIDALLLSLADARTRLAQAEVTIADHETRITNLEP